MGILKQCQKWHEEDKHLKIVDALEAMVYIPLTAGARTAPPASSRKMAGSSSLSPAIPSPWAGSSLPWD